MRENGCLSSTYYAPQRVYRYFHRKYANEETFLHRFGIFHTRSSLITMSMIFSSVLDVGKLWPLGQIWLVTCFPKSSFIGTQPHPFNSFLSEAALLPQQPCWVATTETMWSTELKWSLSSPLQQSLPTPALHLGRFVSVPPSQSRWIREEPLENAFGIWK